MPERALRRAVRVAALTVFLIAITWTALLVLAGGFDTEVLGLRITTNEPLRPLLIASVTLTVYLLAGARAPFEARPIGALIGLAEHHGIPSFGARHRWLAPAIAVGISGWLVFAGVRWNTWVAGGMDSNGYVTQADRWLAGELVVADPAAGRVPWPDGTATLTPLGYMPRADGTNVPYYAPGLPMLMAAAKRLGGHCAAFWVAPLAGGLLVFATFLIGRRAHSDAVGVAAAVLVACSPTVIFFVISPLSDVPAAAFWALAIAGVLAGGGRRRAVLLAAAAGASVSAAVLIRPNLVPLAVVLGSWLLWQDAAEPTLRRRLARAAAFTAGVVPGCLLVAYFNAAWYGSPLETGPGSLAYLFDIRNVVANVARYPRWFVETQTFVPALAVVAMLLPIRAIWQTRTAARAVILFAAFLTVTLAIHALFIPLEEWWFLRYMLPAWPPIFVALAMLLAWCWQRANRIVGLVAVAVVAWLAVDGLTTARARGVFDLGAVEVRYVEAARLVREHTEPGSVILSMQHSGTLRHYGGRYTVRYDALAPEWLDRALEWLAREGAHPYVLLEEWELPEFRERFEAHSPSGNLSEGLVFTYKNPHGPAVYLFDPPGRREAPPLRIVQNPAAAARCEPFLTPRPLLRESREQ